MFFSNKQSLKTIELLLLNTGPLLARLSHSMEQISPSSPPPFPVVSPHLSHNSNPVFPLGASHTGNASERLILQKWSNTIQYKNIKVLLIKLYYKIFVSIIHCTEPQKQQPGTLTALFIKCKLIYKCTKKTNQGQSKVEEHGSQKKLIGILNQFLL